MSTEFFLTTIPKAQREKFLTFLMKGLSLKSAAKLCRIEPRALTRFFKTASDILEKSLPYYIPADYSDSENELVAFYLACGEATAKFEEATLNTVTIASEQGDWRAAQFILQSRNPEDWGSKGGGTVVNVNQQNSNSQDPTNNQLGYGHLDLNKLTVKEIEILEDLLRKASGSPTNSNIIDVTPNNPIHALPLSLNK